ncbi:MAG: DUF434 domain-containing protein [Candidatus Desulfofervidus auxilii]|nr:DUF434 domain-containing protein [Candidatus Desulfofervidus auxilii]
MKLPHQAISHLRFLLDKGYSSGQALQIIGNRYQLNSWERKWLERGVCSIKQAKIRERKKKGLWRLRQAKLGIDGHNVLITIESAIKGKPLLLADDGFIRDMAGVSASYQPSSTTEKALELIFEILKLYQPLWLDWYFDAPLSFSGELAANVRKKLKDYHLSGTAQAVPVPEHYLIHHELIATSDSALIDICSEVIDLAGEVLKFCGFSFSLFKFKNLNVNE